MGLAYSVDAVPCGIFKSQLEFRWFCRLRQFTKEIQYVGHQDNWRDFLIRGESVEIKPNGIGTDTDVLRNVVARVPHSFSRLFLIIGDPMSFDVYRAVRDASWHGQWNIAKQEAGINAI